MDCFASLAMTVAATCHIPQPSLRANGSVTTAVDFNSQPYHKFAFLRGPVHGETFGGNLNDAADQAGARFVFQVNEDEAMIFRQLLIQNQKPYVSRRLTIGIPLLGFASVILPVWVAYDRDLLSISAVLIAEWSFAVGYLGLLIAITLSARRLYRDLLRATRSAEVSFDCSFDDAGLTIRKALSRHG
jgi:hypothetical protein